MVSSSVSWNFSASRVQSKLSRFSEAQPEVDAVKVIPCGALLIYVSTSDMSSTNASLSARLFFVPSISYFLFSKTTSLLM